MYLGGCVGGSGLDRRLGRHGGGRSLLGLEGETAASLRGVGRSAAAWGDTGAAASTPRSHNSQHLPLDHAPRPRRWEAVEPKPVHQHLQGRPAGG